MDTASEIRAAVDAIRTIKASHPEMLPDDPVFVDTLDGACDINKIVSGIVRDYRRNITLVAAIEKCIEELNERKKQVYGKASKALYDMGEIVNEIHRLTEVRLTFNGPSYSMTTNVVGIVELKLPPVNDVKDKYKGLDKMKDLYFQRIELLSKVDQIKAEEAILKQHREQALSTIVRIDQDVIDEAPSHFEHGKSMVRLGPVDIIVKDLGDDVIIDDEDVIPDKFWYQPLQPPPPPKKIDKAKLLMALLERQKNPELKEILGAKLSNGRKSVNYRVKKS